IEKIGTKLTLERTSSGGEILVKIPFEDLYGTTGELWFYVGAESNTAPQAYEEIPELTMTLHAEATVDLNAYFKDLEEDLIFFEMSDAPDPAASPSFSAGLNDNMLTLTAGMMTGTDTVTVRAVDAHGAYDAAQDQ